MPVTVSSDTEREVVLRRETSLLQANGTLGLVATNTVAQGDSREVGLDAMVANGFTITRAIQSRSWPAASANLEYAAVWGTPGPVEDHAPRVADDTVVDRITTLLEPAGRTHGKPLQLAENKGIVFEGCKLRGTGFVVDLEEAAGWASLDPRNSEVLFPYLNGEDLNSRPDSSASRWVIDFTRMDERAAASFSAPFERVWTEVRPVRAKLGGDLAAKWWLYERPRNSMRAAVAALSEVLVITRHSKTVMPMRVRSGQVFSDATNVFATDCYGDQAVLSSSLHQLWAITYASTLETRVRYTPSEVFETFPRPARSARLIDAGQVLHEERREVMLRRGLSLTNLYNLVNDSALPDALDPDVARMRTIHVELDEAVMDALGWSNVPLGHGFHSYRQMNRWSVSPAARTEILDRLVEENHRRAQAEGRRGGDAQRTRVQADRDALFD